MQQIKTSLYAQIFYMLGMGAGFLILPNTVLGLFGFPAASDIWIRVLGALAIVFAGYYYTSVRHELVPFFWSTVWGRYLFCSALAVMAIVYKPYLMLLLFAGIEAGLAVWTHVGLRRLSKV